MKHVASYHTTKRRNDETMLSTSKIIGLHLVVCTLVLSVSAGICFLWWWIVSTPSTIEDEFRHSETLQLLQIIIGFTYVNVIQSFFASLREKTALTAELCAIFATNEKLSEEFLDKIIGLGVNDPGNPETNSWTYWATVYEVPDKYKAIFTKVIIADNSDHGQLFSMLGPWLAIGVFYFFHPPVAYREDGSIVAWVIIYSVSICILFSFLLTMWIVERGVDVGLIRPNGQFYDCTLQAYMEKKTKHMRKNASMIRRKSQSYSGSPFTRATIPVRHRDICL